MKKFFSLTTLNLIKATCISMIKDYPMFCRFELTSKCNFRCEFCHIHRKNNIKQDITTAQVITIIDALFEVGTSFLYITGGEPLIREDITEILKYAKKKNMYILLGTNGSLLLKIFDKIHKYIDNIHLSIQTISKFKEITGSTKENFIGIYKSIKLLINNNIPTQINIPIYKNNINEMLDIFNFINKSFPNIDIQFLPMELLSPNKEDNEQMKYLLPNIDLFNDTLAKIKKCFDISINIFNDDIKKTKNIYNMRNKELCKAGNNMLVINSCGELEYPCEFLKLEKFMIKSKTDIKKFLNKINQKQILKNKLKLCKNCINSCYLQPSYFLTINGFYQLIKSTLFRIYSHTNHINN